MDGNKHKHLEFIQGVIDRMGRNSFFVRGWAITLLVGIFVVSATGNGDMGFTIALLFAAFLTLGSFWLLDGYFLAQERRYRKFYDEVRLKPEEEIDFVMVPQQMPLWGEAIRSMTLILFYFPIIWATSAVFGYLLGGLGTEVIT